MRTGGNCCSIRPFPVRCVTSAPSSCRMNQKLLVLVVFFAVLSGYAVNGFGKKLKHTIDCQKYVTQLDNVITIMCNNIANGTNNTLRDACIGCFQAAAMATNNQPSLAAMATCATTYLANTNYSRCITAIQGAAANEVNPPVGKCKSGYCGFVRCIRSVNADILISRCYNASIIGNPAIAADQQVTLYKNITSCILAMARCSTVNPITGETQTNQITSTTYDKWGKPHTTTTRLTNALQITPGGDLRVIAFPSTISVQNYFCSNQNSLTESTWNNYTC